MQLLLYRHGRSDTRYVLPYNYVRRPILPSSSIASAELYSRRTLAVGPEIIISILSGIPPLMRYTAHTYLHSEAILPLVTCALSSADRAGGSPVFQHWDFRIVRHS